MNAALPAGHDRLTAVLDLAAQRVDAATLAWIEVLAAQYLRRLDAQDLGDRAPEALLQDLLSHLELGTQRPPGQPKLRIYTPDAGAGRTARHSVIQIVNDDMPFLVDSTSIEVNRQGLTLHLIAHPVLTVERDADGQLRGLAALAQPHGQTHASGSAHESWMHIEVDRLIDAEQQEALQAGILSVLADVRHAVQDWKPMLARLEMAMAELADPPESLPADAVAEARAFLQWLADEHMVLLGYRRHDLVRDGSDTGLRIEAGSGLGLLRDDASDRLSGTFAALPADTKANAHAPLPLVLVTKSNTRSTVHRYAYTDYIGVKRYGPDGQVIGEHRFIGLFTSSAYGARVFEIPLLRGKAQAVIDRAGFPAGGHLAKALAHVLETFPRDDLFQIPPDDLYETAVGIVGLGERQRLRVFPWTDPYQRFVSCLVYVPRDAYSTEVRMKFQRILMDAFNGWSADFDVLLTEQVLARIRFTVRTTPGRIPAVDRPTLERRLASAARRWDDELREALLEAGDELALYKRWSSAFPLAYRERVAPRAALADLRKLEGLTPQQPLALALYERTGAPSGALGLKVYRLGEPLVLSDSLPMLEHMGLRVLAEASWRLQAPGGEGRVIAMHDFEVQASLTGEYEFDTLARLFEDAFARVLRGEVDSDDFNRLVLLAALSADEVVVLRAYAKYLKQIGFAQAQATIAAALAAHPRMARMLVQLFRLRLDAEAHDLEAATAQQHAIEQALDKVTQLTEDVVLRQLLALVLATLRTNYWRTGLGHSGEAGPRRPFLSFKFDPAAIPGMPQPRPLAEIYVYSPRFEGVHLRGGKVARGGLRWSDRSDDYRTEVLGLMKAQMVKNTVIVPVGAKGGFVLKKAPPAQDRDALLQEGIACYQDYLRGLLDLTDNRVGERIVPPPHVVRLDGDDPYLVVAADKGTAAFSDHANAISAEYGHWLGDAFASGGSRGYDHKAMGITARGAWESVKRHFRELGVDIQATDFTAVGIGDMSGDVFGNGMLLSRHIRLVAAFDHRHIFIDPSPDAARSHAERERLFRLPRSSWADYDEALISEGGGVWARSEKSVPLSPQAREVLGITAEALTPAELVSAILRAPVDLLYNGGIGTYVKASRESHADVGDRANDAVRVNGGELRCKVVGEGGNLGFTQRGRVEAALAGVRLNTDAIDNSAGVDTSDHEVNIKILLGLAITQGALSEDERNALLPTMTDEVAALVLRDNYEQTQALALARRQASAQLEEHARFVRFLERQGRLDRALEYLPSEDEIAERAARAQGLVTPELAVLLAYSKMWLYEQVLPSDLADDPWIAETLQRYFPQQLAQRLASHTGRHPLRREIVATQLVNALVNRAGPTFAWQMVELSGAPPAQVVRAWLLARDAYDSTEVWREIEALDNRVSDEVQAQLMTEWRVLLARGTAWFLRSRHASDPAGKTVAHYAGAVAALRPRLEEAAQGTRRAAAWIQAGVPPALAHRVDAAGPLASALDIADIAASASAPFALAADVHFAVERLGLEKLRQQIALLPATGHWQALARVALADDVATLQRTIASAALADSAGSPAERLAAWESRKGPVLARVRRMLGEMGEGGTPELAMLSVALRELRQVVD